MYKILLVGHIRPTRTWRVVVWEARRIEGANEDITRFEAMKGRSPENFIRAD